MVYRKMAHPWKIWIIISAGLILKNMAAIPDVDNFWPEVADDLGLVTWAHATNSQDLLDQAIRNDSIMMLEADVLMGHLNDMDLTEPAIPIMAHPPARRSDLSLQSFVQQILLAIQQNGVKKGIKLDFKQLKVVQQSLDILSAQRDELNFPIWLNADILAGPVDAIATPVDPDVFLSLCVEFFPEATLSIGWTTQFTNINDSRVQYTMEDVKLMAETIEKNHVTQPVTFPIRAAFVDRSIDALTWLSDNVPDSTLTVWSSASDDVNIQSLVWLQEVIGADAVYFDLPPDQQKEFNSLRPVADANNSAAAVRFWPPGAAFYATIGVLLLTVLFSQLHVSNSNYE